MLSIKLNKIVLCIDHWVSYFLKQLFEVCFQQSSGRWLKRKWCRTWKRMYRRILTRGFHKLQSYEPIKIKGAGLWSPWSLKMRKLRRSPLCFLATTGWERICKWVLYQKLCCLKQNSSSKMLQVYKKKRKIRDGANNLAMIKKVIWAHVFPFLVFDVRVVQRFSG